VRPARSSGGTLSCPRGGVGEGLGGGQWPLATVGRPVGGGGRGVGSRVGGEGRQDRVERSCCDPSGSVQIQ
jgi:hypothetical protein